MLSPVHIADSLAADRTRKNVDRLAALLEADGIDIGEYIAELGRRPEAMRWSMTWLLSHYLERHGGIGRRDQRLIWKLLKECDNRSMERDLWRTLSFLDVDENIAGEVFDTAVQVIASATQPIAVRAHAIFAARKIAMPYPELREELASLLEQLQNDESPAIRSRSRKTIGDMRQGRRRTAVRKAAAANGSPSME